MLTAGESHGKALVAVLEGLPAGVPVSTEELAHQLARRRQGHGRGGRQKFESDRFEILTGVRHGRTMGSPIAVTIPNLEFEQKYAELMGVEGEMDPAKRLTRPRPGHADLVGSQKYGFDDVRNVLERASARETAARVTVGAFCRAFLGELSVALLSHVVQIGTVKISKRRQLPTPDDLAAIDRSPVRCFDPEASKQMVAEIDRLRKDRDTIGGVFEVLAYGAPPGLGSYVALRPQAGRASGPGADEHPVGEGRGGRRRVRHGCEAGIEGARRDRARARPAHARHGARGGHRRRHEHRRADPGPSRHEAVLHRPEAAADRGPGDRRARGGHQAAHRRVCGPGGRGRGRGRRRRSNSRTRCWRSSEAIRSARRRTTWAGTSTG